MIPKACPVFGLRPTALVAALCLGTACGGSEHLDPPMLRLLRVEPTDTTLDQGDQARFRALGDWSDGHSEPASVTWSATGGTIDPTGVYQAAAAGVFTVVARATSSALEASATANVVAPNPPPPPPPPPAPPPPPPPQVPANECAAPRPEWIWCDDFEQNRLSRYFEVDTAGGRFVRAAQVGRDGSWGMRARFGAGQVSVGSLKVAFGRTPAPYFRAVDAGTANHRDIYWRVYLRNEPGWTGGGGDKLSRAMVLATSGWAQAAIGHVWSSGQGSRYLAVDPASGTDPQGNLKSTKYNDFPNLRWLGLARGNTPLFASPYLGRWICVEARVRLNTAGQSDGLFELWLDGVPEARRANLNWLGSYSAYGLNAVFLENYWNAGAPTSQERYFDNFVVSTKPIGC